VILVYGLFGLQSFDDPIADHLQDAVEWRSQAHRTIWHL
jgi:hypothetical protein